MIGASSRVAELAPQPADVDLDDVGVAGEVDLPDAVEDLALGQHLPGAAHEELDHVELAGRQRDLGVAATTPAGVPGSMPQRAGAARASAGARRCGAAAPGRGRPAPGTRTAW